MINYKQTFVYKVLRKVWHLIKKKNYCLMHRGVALLEEKKAPLFAEGFRYVYIKICSDFPRKINLYWHNNDKLCETDDLFIQAGTAIYEFDIALIRVKVQDQACPNSYFQGGQVNNLELRCDENIDIKWSKFSLGKRTFKREKTPVVQMMAYPGIIHLELTRRCNINCYMCRENRKKEDLKKYWTDRFGPTYFL